MGDITQSETASRFKTSTPEDFGPDSSGMFTSERDSQQTDAELTYNSNNHGSGAASYGSNIFSSAHHFSVSGGTFTNITHNHNTVSTALPDFRQIPLGDIDLRELRLERTSNCFVRQRQSTCRVYAARVEGRRSRVTVAIYEGDGAKEVCGVALNFLGVAQHN
ncbi:hypothetical protein C8R47DRAFT_3791 [Mycena vitilis]|nr:hypothetical protein C8R47DRAFT_3791 [Mycena vitilis]